MNEKSAREKYRETKIECVKIGCDLVSDLMRMAAELQFKLPTGSLGRSETYRKLEDEKRSKDVKIQES